LPNADFAIDCRQFGDGFATSGKLKIDICNPLYIDVSRILEFPGVYNSYSTPFIRLRSGIPQTSLQQKHFHAQLDKNFDKEQVYNTTAGAFLCAFIRPWSTVSGSILSEKRFPFCAQCFTVIVGTHGNLLGANIIIRVAQHQLIIVTVSCTIKAVYGVCLLKLHMFET
jgi:hypothetical protein